MNLLRCSSALRGLVALLVLMVLSISAGFGIVTPVLGDEPAWQEWFEDGSLERFRIVSGTATYTVIDGVLVGTTAEGSPNTFLATKAPLQDFELEFEVKVDNELNSGVQVRSHLAKEGEKPEGAGGPLPADRLYGPQCEISIDGHAGNFYDEARRGVWWSGLTGTDSIRTDAAKAAFKKGEWNAYRIVVVGDHFQSWINGVPTADFRQANDPEGHIGFQVHGIGKGTGPYSVRWRKVRVKALN
ncbi:MAG: DUF1080 domain-containing protein [Planctomycetota bacterium]|nr:MAG: DUF1080 domain-containing protein [Planctomycetota bacterium]